MDEYWNLISNAHQEKLMVVAQTRGVTIETAMRNIVNYLKTGDQSFSKPDYFKEFITGQDIEGMIEMIFLSQSKPKDMGGDYDHSRGNLLSRLNPRSPG